MIVMHAKAILAKMVVIVKIQTISGLVQNIICTLVMSHISESIYSWNYKRTVKKFQMSLSERIQRWSMWNQCCFWSMSFFSMCQWNMSPTSSNQSTNLQQWKVKILVWLCCWLWRWSMWNTNRSLQGKSMSKRCCHVHQLHNRASMHLQSCKYPCKETTVTKILKIPGFDYNSSF